METVLSYLERNDVFAHSYAALSPGILDAEGKLKECVKEARQRGVWFDLSHGSANFSFDVAHWIKDLRSIRFQQIFIQPTLLPLFAVWLIP